MFHTLMKWNVHIYVTVAIASLYPDITGEQSEQPVQLLQYDTGGPGPPRSTGGLHKPIAVIWVAARCTRGTGAATLTASEGKSSGPESKRITSNDIRVRDVTYYPKTLYVIMPASRCNCKAAAITSCLSIV